MSAASENSARSMYRDDYSLVLGMLIIIGENFGSNESH